MPLFEILEASKGHRFTLNFKFIHCSRENLNLVEFETKQKTGKIGVAAAAVEDVPLHASHPPPCDHPRLATEPAVREVCGVGPPTGADLAPPE